MALPMTLIAITTFSKGIRRRDGTQRWSARVLLRQLHFFSDEAQLRPWTENWVTFDRGLLSAPAATGTITPSYLTWPQLAPR